MGTEVDIRDKLLDLLGKQPPAVFDADSHHAPLDPEARRYSPLTYAQGRNLNQPRYGVGLVFASQALGLSFLPEAFKQLIPSDLLEDIRADCTQMPSGLIGGDEMEGWLQQYLREHDGYERLVVYTLFNGAAARVGEQIDAALSVCHRHEKGQRRWLRVLFLFGPGATWDWLSPMQQTRHAIAGFFRFCWMTSLIGVVRWYCFPLASSRSRFGK